MLNRIQALIVLAALPSCFTAWAAEAPQTIDGLCQNTYELPLNHEQIRLVSIATTDIPKKVEIQTPVCGDPEENCLSHSKIIETIPVVQVRAHYRDSQSQPETRDVFIDVNFPREQFTPQEIAQIQSASDYFLDPDGSKARQLQDLANQMISFTVTEKTSLVPVTDLSRSPCRVVDETGRVECDNPSYSTTAVRRKYVTFKHR